MGLVWGQEVELVEVGQSWSSKIDSSSVLEIFLESQRTNQFRILPESISKKIFVNNNLL
jgi:hypothetical protein